MGQIAHDMRTSLQGIANRAQREKKARFRHLYSMLNTTNLKQCFYQLRKDAAPGIDKVTFSKYEKDLDENVERLVEQLKQKRYRAKLVRRKYIPKGKGKMRPLGILVLEDKLLQLAATKILSAIYEADFLDMSWGYRPGRGPREASRVLSDALVRGKFGWAVEADIRGFFDNISHEWMLRMVEKRVDDQAFVRLIAKWLRAGVMEEGGKVLHPVTGTPQGGIISPILANIYLHYVLDLWFARRVQPGCRGEAYMMRYADDWVCMFQYQEDARRCEQALPERLGKFGLEVAPEKTRKLRFSRFDLEPNEAFEFLGFEFRWVLSRKGKPRIQRRTAPKKLKQSVDEFTEWIKKNRHQRTTTLMFKLRSKLRGYWNYYGVRGNYQSLHRYWRQVAKLLFKWLNRRSHRRSYTWQGFYDLLRDFDIPKPRIVETSVRQLSFNL